MSCSFNFWAYAVSTDLKLLLQFKISFKSSKSCLAPECFVRYSSHQTPDLDTGYWLYRFESLQNLGTCSEGLGTVRQAVSMLDITPWKCFRRKMHYYVILVSVPERWHLASCWQQKPPFPNSVDNSDPESSGTEESVSASKSRKQN